MTKKQSNIFSLIMFFLFLNATKVLGQETRLLRQPDINATHIIFTYGSDIWVNSLGTNVAKRITSTQAVESNPYLSPIESGLLFHQTDQGKLQCILFL